MNKQRVLRTVLVVLLVALVASCSRAFDFDGDRKADHVVQLDNGTWRDFGKPASDPALFVGQVGDKDVAADYDGDGRTDAAVIRGDDWVTSSDRGTVNFAPPVQLPAFVGSPRVQMIPVPADYDGDHKAEVAWYRDSDATWFIEGRAPQQFGHGPTVPTIVPGQPYNDQQDQDMPVPADYDGDAKADLATYNPRTHLWEVQRSRDMAVTAVTMPGSNGEPAWPAPADYDGLGHAQRATYGSAGWRIEGHADPILFGNYTALDPVGNGLRYPAAADYDGDGRADLSYVSETGVWLTRSSADPSLVTTITIPALVSPSSPRAVVFGYAQTVNIARLTLVGKFCHPSAPGYPHDC